MIWITVRELSRRTAAVLNQVETTGRPVVVTRNGRPVALVVPIGADTLDDLLLAQLPGLAESLAEAEAELAVGNVRSLDAVLAESEDDGPE